MPAELREAINDCMADSAAGKMTVIPTLFKSVSAKQAMQDAFQIVGGVPRLAHYADRDYGRFLQLWSKTLPLTVAGDPDAPVRFEVPWISGDRFASMAAREPVTVSEDIGIISLHPAQPE